MITMKSQYFFSIVAALGLRAIAYNTATTDALWKDSETSGGDLYPSDDSRGIAVNADAISSDEWIRIAKYGEWRDGSKARTLQVLALENATAMARNFNSIVGKIGRFMRGAPIFIGHPDCDPCTYTDHRRIGKITALDARADGLYAKPAWNDLGEQNLREGYHVYPSSVWRFPRPKAGESRVFPDMFQSLGLTNFPAGDVDPVTYNSENNTVEPIEPTQNDMNPELLSLLGLPADATPEDIIAAVEALKAAAQPAAEELPAEEETAENSDDETGAEITDEEKEALKRRLADETAAKDAAMNALALHRAADATRLIGDAISAGRLTAAEKAGWESRFATDHDAAMNALSELRPAKGLNTTPLNLGHGKVNISTVNERMAAVNSEVSRRMTEQGLSYDTAYNAVKRDPEFAHIFEAMKQPGTEHSEY